MATRGRPRKDHATTVPVRVADDVVMLKLDQIEAILKKNSQDIEDLKHQVAMGKGGIKAIFIVGAIVAAIATGLGLYKNVGG